MKSRHEPPSKLCLNCARRKLAGLPPRPCGECVLLNIDQISAKAHATARKPFPVPLRTSKSQETYGSSLNGGVSSKPARAAFGSGW